MTVTPLGAFLRGRRSAVRPADVGFPDAGVRRVSGLRREEVALLAGVSVDYYVRLEQGRERNPSAPVLEALSTALRLDDDGRAHLFRLARLTPRARAAPGRESVDPALLQLMNAWPDNPALVLGRAYDVLAANAIGHALFGGFTFSRNLMLLLFLDPGAPDFYGDWPTVAANSVAGFRMQLGKAPDDPRVRAVLRELLERSPAFADLWARHDARGKALELKTFHHRDVGELTLHMQTFDVRGSTGQELVVYQAEKGSPSADALALLGTIVFA
jgi:transcriptional regulator with XRE-family HTH domain